MNNRNRLVNRLKERNNKAEKLNELKRRAALCFFGYLRIAMGTGTGNDSGDGTRAYCV